MANIVMFGPFPPPVHGASYITEILWRLAESCGRSVIRVNSSPHLARNALGYHWRRLAAAITCSRILMSSRYAGSRVLYISVSGGWGQLYDILVSTVCILFGYKIVLHHHSFAYIHRKSPVSNFLFAMTRRHAVNYVLCQKMKDAIHARYGEDLSVRVLMNSEILVFAPEQPPRKMRRQNCRVIGFLANLTLEKGLDSFLRVHQELERRGEQIKAIVAGPCREPTAQSMLREALASSETLTYVGAVSGAEKHRFFQDIDVLIFPTRYVNEADPLVIHEAILAGVPVIASDRGCISSVITGAGGYVMDANGSDIACAVEKVQEWIHQPQRYQQAAQMCLANHETALPQSKEAFVSRVFLD